MEALPKNVYPVKPFRLTHFCLVRLTEGVHTGLRTALVWFVTLSETCTTFIIEFFFSAARNGIPFFCETECRVPQFSPLSKSLPSLQSRFVYTPIGVH